MTELQQTFDGFGPEVEELLDFFGDLAVGQVGFAASVGVYINAYGLCHADGVGQLHEHFIGNARRHHVFGDVASRVGRRTVYLRWVFARERAAAVGTLAAVGVDDNLATGQSGVAVGAADDELTRRIDEIMNVVVEQRQYLFATLGLDARNQNMDNIFVNLGQHGLVVVHKLVVLRAHDDGVDALRRIVFIIFNRHLTLGVGAQIGHYLAFTADIGQHFHDEMRQIERHGHVVFCFVAGITEHHALVAGTLFVFVLAVDAAVDVVALLVNSRQNAARIAVKLVFSLRVADALDGLSGDVL